MLKSFTKFWSRFESAFDDFNREWKEEMDVEFEKLDRAVPLKDDETERTTTETEHRPDGTVVTRKTVVRRSVSTTTTIAKKP